MWHHVLFHPGSAFQSLRRFVFSQFVFFQFWTASAPIWAPVFSTPLRVKIVCINWRRESKFVCAWSNSAIQTFLSCLRGLVWEWCFRVVGSASVGTLLCFHHHPPYYYWMKESFPRVGATDAYWCIVGDFDNIWYDEGMIGWMSFWQAGELEYLKFIKLKN
jgi:hypothetical protein